MSGSPAADMPAPRPAEGPAAGRHAAPGLRPYALRCDHRTTPLGIDEPAPLLSWRLASGVRADDPTAYRVRVAERPEDLDHGGRPLWDTGRVEDPGAIGVVFAGPALTARTRYHWRVAVWSSGAAAPAEAMSWFETAVYDTGAWRASWITHDPHPIDVVDAPTEGAHALDNHGLTPCPLLRRTFTGSADGRARLQVSARGLYEVRLNGTRVGDAELAPGWTDYTHRVQYQTYDVSELIRDGENVLAATVADGWWSGFVGFEPRRAGAHYGSFPQFLAELHLATADGRATTVVTDDAWRTHTGAIRHADLLMGECHDLRHAVDGWDLPGFDDTGWAPARVTDADHRLLVASVDEPVRAMAELRPRSVTRVSHDVHVVDFGQNIAGRVRLRVDGLASGARVVVRHAEVLDETHRLYTANLRTAAATDVLIGDGRDHVVFEPRFTYHGFRYAEISGVRELSGSDVVAVALHSDTPWTGTFDCSDPEIRLLHECVTWGQRSNFVSVPTDCPQRDERLGWLADAQVFLPTAALNADVAAFFTKWLRDVDDARTPDGGFTNVAPRLTGVADEGAPGWGDAGVIVPWHLYRTYDDPRFLARALDSMRDWVDLIHRHNPDLIWRRRVGPHFSDWLAPGTPTPRDVIATAYFAHSTHLTARAADVLGHRDAARAYHRLAAGIRTAFAERFVTVNDNTITDQPALRVAGDTQTGYLVALAFGLLPEKHTDAAARRLAELIETAGPALQTGFLGVALAAPVLDAYGRADLAHALLRRTEVPSWLFPLRHGATTIWERWDGWTPETGFRAPSMNSFNHYALGSIGEWLYRGVAGLDQSADSTGYRQLSVRPSLGGLSHASARYESVRGTVAVGWQRRDDTFSLRVRVPPGATAEVAVPTTDPRSVRESGVAAADGDHITRLATASGHVVYRVASGVYHFTAAFRPASAPAEASRLAPSATAPSSAGPHEEDTP
ncbi:alpha-L-rhamnosidase [Streptomyces sp. AK02-01A]|uniref:alpha-L-rhamnosidase n=1 Tax=Streptomyces sp. AK02-01A TaxID=3028648 RepID=UPI0029B73CC4|nr:family 78 glycoside hydrolase catalytic domain [Streptomyces sp. AK02-01A]MDX3850160.1 family 78 glycoside hydrolase catalytic domain [Streptomyces sp. AK02-01A]